MSDTAVRRARSIAADTTRRLLLPPSRMTVAEWAEQRRILGSAESPERRGKWSNKWVPYAVEPMQRMTDDGVLSVTLMWAAQTAKSSVIENVCGHAAEMLAGPMMIVQPTLAMAKWFSKRRFGQFIRNTPALREIFTEAKRGQDGGSTLLDREFVGGSLIFAGANSAASLASRQIWLLNLDEPDRYPHDVDGEGAPDEVAKKRQNSFTDTKKLLVTGTPTIKGISVIEKYYDAGSQAEYHVPCPHCGDYVLWTWELMRWDDDPATAVMVCVSCAQEIEEKYKTQSVLDGRWVHGFPDRTKHLSYHLASYHSLFRRWPDIVDDHLRAKDDKMSHRAWVNTELAQSVGVDGVALLPQLLEARKDRYSDILPDGVGLITAAVDVQGDRLECDAWGWGAHEEAWVLEHAVLYGDPQQDAVWRELDTWRARVWTTTSGATLKIAGTVIDTGYLKDRVYTYCRARRAHNVWPIKGVGGWGRELVSKPAKVDRGQLRGFNVGVDVLKEEIYNRLRLDTPGPRYVHFASTLDREWFNGLCSEILVPRGRGYEWQKVRRRNEPFDLAGYNLACLAILAPYRARLGQLADAVRVQGELALAASEHGPLPVPVTPSIETAFAPPEVPAPPVRGGVRDVARALRSRRGGFATDY
jgi:phage terminase large subunit GpA-like protein